MTNFKLMYQDTSCMFFQTPKTKLFNDNYGDLHASILSREQHIAERLLNIIRLSVQQAPRISRLCARLDCLVAMAKVSMELQLVRPNVVAAKELSIRAGRHIMLQLQQTPCTTNDTRLGVQAGKLVTILNAPNSSGKSVYMKQVGKYCSVSSLNVASMCIIHSHRSPSLLTWLTLAALFLRRQPLLAFLMLSTLAFTVLSVRIRAGHPSSMICSKWQE